MRTFSFCLFMAVACLLMFSASNAWASSGTVTVHFKDSNGNYLGGGVVMYYNSGWQTLGTTVAGVPFSGVVTLPSTKTNTDIKLVYLSGNKATTNNSVNITINPVFNYTTVPVTVKLETCDGDPLVGDAKYYYQGWIPFGGGTTPATMELLPYSGLTNTMQGGYDFQVKYNGRTSATIRQDISVDPVVVFKTTKVEFITASPVYMYNGGWQLFTNPSEVLGGTQNYAPYPTKTADFKFGNTHNPTVTLNITGCSVTNSIAPCSPQSISVVSGCGNGTATLTAPAATSYLWSPGGQTTQSIVVHASGTYSVDVTYDFPCPTGGGTTIHLSTNVTVTSNVVTVQFLDSHGNGIAGAAAYFYRNGWVQFPNLTDANGITCRQFDLGTPKDFKLVPASCGTQYWLNVDVSSNPILVATTVAVTVRLETCEGTPLVGNAKYYCGGFTSIGNTPATIELLPYSGLGPGQGSYDFQVAYNGRTSTTTRQDIAVDPVVVFKTTKVTSSFGGNTYYYNGGWQPFTNPSELMGGTSNISPFGTSTADFKFGGTSGSYPTYTFDITGCAVTVGPPPPKVGASGIEAIPTEFELQQNYPNPFNPSTTITVALPVDATVSLGVYNTLGQKVAELINGAMSAGYHDVQFDASNLASGLYIYRIAAKGTDGKDFTKVQKMLLMK